MIWLEIVLVLLLIAVAYVGTVAIEGSLQAGEDIDDV